MDKFSVQRGYFCYIPTDLCICSDPVIIYWHLVSVTVLKSWYFLIQSPNHLTIWVTFLRVGQQQKQKQPKINSNSNRRNVFLVLIRRPKRLKISVHRLHSEHGGGCSHSYLGISANEEAAIYTLQVDFKFTLDYGLQPIGEKAHEGLSMGFGFVCLLCIWLNFVSIAHHFGSLSIDYNSIRCYVWLQKGLKNSTVVFTGRKNGVV